MKFHAIFTFAGAPQPFCGECAVLFFHEARYASWLRQYDVPAVLSNTYQLLHDSAAELEELIYEIDALRSGPPSPRGSEGSISLGNLGTDVIGEIPKTDWTYRSLGMTLIPHCRIPDMYLLEYRTFQGSMAYQPCSRGKLDDLFESLAPLDEHDDAVFKQARVWSCNAQSAQGLPRELRWVIATIYNFSNEVLRKKSKEAVQWSLRSWLLHWYTMADRLITKFGVAEATPDVDWFQTGSVGEHPGPMCAYPLTRLHDSGSSSDATVIHHCPMQQSYAPDGQATVVDAWLRGQQHVILTDEAAALEPVCASSPDRRSLNPAAEAFVPSPPSKKSMAGVENIDEGYSSMTEEEAGAPPEQHRA